MKEAATTTLLALDAHGGDYGPDVTLPAALDALELEPRLELALVGLPEAISEAAKVDHPRLRLIEADSVLAGDARPVAILRQGAGSSLGRAMELVAQGNVQGCVSAGSTVALMALAVKQLGPLRGIHRPALMSAIPSADGSTSVLDLGANLNVDARQLVQFAIMGSVVRETDERSMPRIGLLNVGHEETKGRTVVREAHERLRELPLNYVGFIEGHDIFAGRVEVAVCDGFSGNLLLKSSEGLARMLFEELRASLNSSPRARLGGWLARPALQDMLARLDPGKHNGAPLLGLRGVVVKSHGNADRAAMVHAILEAVNEARRQVPGRIEARIEQYEAGESN